MTPATKPLINIKPQEGDKGKIVPHLLPCRINYDGQVPASESHWATTQENGTDGSRVGYFRGRKLHGKTVKIPDGYTGAVVEKSAETAEDQPVAEDDPEEPGRLLQMVATKETFDEVVIWGHESTADSTIDPFVRAVEEWISVAETINGDGVEYVDKDNGKKTAHRLPPSTFRLPPSAPLLSTSASAAAE